MHYSSSQNKDLMIEITSTSSQINYQDIPLSSHNQQRPITSAQQLQQIKDQVENDQRRINTATSQIGVGRRPTSPDSKSSQFGLNQVEQERLFKVRRSFQQALNKLSNNDTKEVGQNECKKVIESNPDQPSLRVYLSLLCEKHKNSTTANKELQILLFGHLAKVYKTELLDPLDKPPNLLKTVVRVCENIHSFLKENSSLIHLACANSLVDILDNCFIQKEDKLSLSLIFYEPLASIINGGYDKMGQMAASICLLKLLEYLIERNQDAFYDFLCPKFVQLFIKTKCDHPDFIACLHLIIQNSSLKYATQSIWEIIQRCIKIIETTDTQSYLKKIEACNLLKTIAMKLKDVADLILGYMHRQVIKCLETGQCDRVLKVRSAAIQAKQQWQQVKFISKELEGKKQNDELRGLSPDEIIQARTGYSNIDDVRKQVLEEAQDDLQMNQKPRPQTAQVREQQVRPGSSKKFKMLKELARLNQELRVQKPYSPTAQEKKLLSSEQNWSAATRANNFLKKGGGIGGGNIPGQSQERSPAQRIASHLFQRQSIKDLIMNHMKNKNMTEKELEIYMKGNQHIQDLFQMQLQEEQKQYEHNQDPEYQAIADRVQNSRQYIALRQDFGNHQPDTQIFNKTLTQEQNKSPRFMNNNSTHNTLNSPNKQHPLDQGNDDFEFEEEKMGPGDQAMPTFGSDGNQNLGRNQSQSALSKSSSKGRVAFQDDLKGIPDYSKHSQVQHPSNENYKNQNSKIFIDENLSGNIQQSDQSSSILDNSKQRNHEYPQKTSQNGIHNIKHNDIINQNEGHIDLSGIVAGSKKVSQTDQDSLMNEVLGIKHPNSSIYSNKDHATKEEILEHLKQGRSVAEMDPREIKKLSDKIIKEALREDISEDQSREEDSKNHIKQIQNDTSVHQRIDHSKILNGKNQQQATHQPSFGVLNQLEENKLKFQPKNSVESSVSHIVPGRRQSQSNSSAMNPFEDIDGSVSKQRQNNANQIILDDDNLFEEQIISGGDQAFNPFETQPDNLFSKVEGKNEIQDQKSFHVKPSSNTIEIIPQNKEVLKQFGIPHAEELKQVYPTRPQESKVQYEQRINEIQKQIVKEQAPQLIQKVQLPSASVSSISNQTQVHGDNKDEAKISEIITQNEQSLKDRHDIPTRQDLKRVYKINQLETIKQYDQRISNLQKDILKQQAPQVLEQIESQAVIPSKEQRSNDYKTNDKQIHNLISQNESMLKENYQVPTKQDLKSVIPKKIDETNDQYENRIGQKQLEIAESQAPILIKQLKKDAEDSKISSNQNQSQIDEAVGSYINENESVLKAAYQIPTKSDLKQAIPRVQNENTQSYEARISEAQKEIIADRAPELLSQIQAQAENHVSQQVTFQQRQNQSALSSQSIQQQNSILEALRNQEKEVVVQNYIKENENALKAQFDIPTQKELKSIYKPKQYENQKEYDQRISQIQQSFLKQQAPVVSEQLDKQIESQFLNQIHNEGNNQSFRPSNNNLLRDYSQLVPQQQNTKDYQYSKQNNLQNQRGQSGQYRSQADPRKNQSNLSQYDINSFYDAQLQQSFYPNQSPSSQFQNQTYNQGNEIQQSEDWPYSVINQLKTVEQFMQASFQNIDHRLRNINHKIGDTKYNLAKAQQKQQVSQNQNIYRQVNRKRL